MNFVELQRALRQPRMMDRLPVGLLIVMLISAMAIADGPIASSNFVGTEDPLSENGAWVALTSLSPNGSRFQKNNGAYPDQPGNFSNHAGARTTAVVPADHYSEIVVGHVGNNVSNFNNVGPIVRVQASGPSIDSHYLWWASVANGVNNLYRIDANGSTHTATILLPSSPVVDGDRLRLIARGPVIYGIKNEVRDFIYNTGPDATKYSAGTTGMLAYAGDGGLTNAKIASWSTGAAPVSSGGTWASSTFTGTENPLDEGDRWYPLPGYLGFKKVGGFAIGLNSSNHNASGVWSITPPATQYSEVTLGTVTSGGGGPIVRIDRNNAGQTGWLLFLWADNPSGSAIFKMNPDASFTAVRTFTPSIVSGDKWRLTADGDTLEVFRNGVSQFTYTITDGSYPTGDVGMEALKSNFTFTTWEGGDTAGGLAPTITGFTPTSGPVGTSVTISGTNLTGATAVTFNTLNASFIVKDMAIQATVPAGATTGPLSVTTPGGTATSTSAFNVAAKLVFSVQPTNVTAGAAITVQGTIEDALGNPVTTATNAVTIAIGTNPSSGTLAGTLTANAVNGIATFTNLSINNAGTGYTLTASATGLTGATSSAFNVVSPPTITSFTPTSGPVGTSVTINGTNFTGATAVTFNRVNAVFSVTSATAIQATVPAGATTGPLSVTTPEGTATSTNNFYVTTILPPTITSFTPTSGPVGISVIINGMNFTGATVVTFNGVRARFTVTPATTIRTAVPAGATTGPLRVTTLWGAATSTNDFTVIPAPTITSFTPTSGPVGTSVTISGTNFTGATAVRFNGWSASFTVSSDTVIQATVPTGATTGPLRVTTPGGSAGTNNFTVN